MIKVMMIETIMVMLVVPLMRMMMMMTPSVHSLNGTLHLHLANKFLCVFNASYVKPFVFVCTGLDITGLLVRQARTPGRSQQRQSRNRRAVDVSIHFDHFMSFICLILNLAELTLQLNNR